MTDTEEGRSIKLNCPGAYPTCCIELSLDGLAVNSVLQSHHINDYEGGAGTSTSFDCAPQASLEELIEGTGNALSVYDEAALCSASFKVMRQIVHAWLMDVKQHGNFHADKQLQHFYRSVTCLCISYYNVSCNTLDCQSPFTEKYRVGGEGKRERESGVGVRA